MNAPSDAAKEGLTTEQIAAVGTSPIPDPPGPEARRQPTQTAQPGQRPAGDGRPAGPRPAADDDRSGGPDDGAVENGEPGPAGAAASASDDSGLDAGREPRARLLEGDELQRIVTRWKEIQADFVDDPRTAVEQADALVADLMQRLATMFARERAELEQRWAGGNGVSTEELRQSLRRYRSFFERLLAA
jgi:hypothetical protein